MNIVRELRLKAGMQQKEVALYVGVANPTVSEWEHQKKDPSGERLKKLAKLFGVTPEAILGVDLNAIMAKFTTAYPMPQQNHLPIYGTIKCGPGGLAMEELLGYAQSELDPAEHFCLMCYGDSMSPKIEDGDTVTIHKQEDVETGEIAAVIVDGEEGTLKRIAKQQNALTLIALNPQYPPRTFVGKDMNRVRIVGKAVKVERTL